MYKIHFYILYIKFTSYRSFGVCLAVIFSSHCSFTCFSPLITHIILFHVHLPKMTVKLPLSCLSHSMKFNFALNSEK